LAARDQFNFASRSDPHPAWLSHAPVPPLAPRRFRVHARVGPDVLRDGFDLLSAVRALVPPGALADLRAETLRGDELMHLRTERCYCAVEFFLSAPSGT
jgi:hypothetical protein